MPRERPWLKFTEWAKQYGPIFTVTVPGQRMVVLNDLESATEGLKQTQLADRPHFVVAGDLMDFTRTMVLARDGPELRTQRKLSHIALNPTAVQAFTEVQRKYIHNCIPLLANSKNFEMEIRLSVIRSIVDMVYGIKVDSIDDPFIVQSDTVFYALGEAIAPGRYLADTFPILKYLPSWFPGAGFKRLAAQVRRELDGMCDHPFGIVKRDMADGTAPLSFVSSLLAQVQDGYIDAYPERLISHVAGTLYGGGVDTSFSTVMTFLLAASLNLEVQTKAQEEIRRILGDRLPTIADRPHLPYVHAVVKETMRFYPTAPMGVARRASRDTSVGWYFIPEGSVVIENTWAISRVTGDLGLPADEFHPERFLSASPPPDPTLYAFGTGRRSCVGQTVGENFVFTMIASLLAAYTILPAVDHNGKEIAPELVWLDSTLTRPVPFACRFVPRR
ncbi:cytochrome P450 [Auricularia subglabra TFB-10046 SS5]|nr:cytochrome P450 [Auricularia subglabra TFB-10046 SS5]